jgi:hypothetical protein
MGSNPAPPQHTENSVNPEVGSHLGLHSTVCWPLRGGRGTQYTQKTLKIYRKKKLIKSNVMGELNIKLNILKKLV